MQGSRCGVGLVQSSRVQLEDYPPTSFSTPLCSGLFLGSSLFPPPLLIHSVALKQIKSLKNIFKEVKKKFVSQEIWQQIKVMWLHLLFSFVITRTVNKRAIGTPANGSKKWQAASGREGSLVNVTQVKARTVVPQKKTSLG